MLRRPKFRAPPLGGAYGAPNGLKNLSWAMRIPNMCLILKLDNGKVVSMANEQTNRQNHRAMQYRISILIICRYVVAAGYGQLNCTYNTTQLGALQVKEVFTHDSVNNLFVYSVVWIKEIMALCTATEAYSTEFPSLSRKVCSKKYQCKRDLMYICIVNLSLISTAHMQRGWIWIT